MKNGTEQAFDPHYGQYIIVSDETEIPSWKKLKLNSKFSLCYHPSAKVTWVNNEVRTLVLVGFALHARHPEMNDKDILNLLISNSHDFESLIESCAPLGGSWTMMWVSDNDSFVFSDALGSRELYYSVKSEAVASDPGLFVKYMNHSFLPNPYSTVNEDQKISFWWPGLHSPVSDTEPLLPNHYLSLGEIRSRRYKREHVQLAKSIDPEILFEEIKTLLESQVEALINRSRIDLAFTSGFDSRLNLALLKNFQGRTDFHLIGSETFFTDSRDASDARRIIRELLPKKELRELVLAEKNEHTRQRSRRSSIPREWFVRFGNTMDSEIPKASTVMTGVSCGICRERFVKYIFPVTAYHLCSQSSMGITSFTLKHFRFWLKSARKGSEEYGIHVQDLFHQEQRYGRWLAQIRREQLFAAEFFEPFNNRAILDKVMQLPYKYRRRNPNKLFEFIIKKNWPELLNYPINGKMYNPKGRSEFLKNLVKWIRIWLIGIALEMKFYIKSKFLLRGENTGVNDGSVVDKICDTSARNPL